MSCSNCTGKDKGSNSEKVSCICDRFEFPAPLNIDAGLDKLTRQMGTFSEFRRAMLHDILITEAEVIDNSNTLVKLFPLSGWRARKKDDPGIMLLEMWAYICDCLSFYDEVLANESYIRTCDLKPDLRRLVGLLGYLPRPAVGSMVELAAIADGRLRINLPAGTAFRSGAFNGNPPQVFELDQDTFIHPFTNRFGIVEPHKGVVLSDNPDSLLVDLQGDIKEGMTLFLKHETDFTQCCAVRVKKIEKITGTDSRQYTKLTFSHPTQLKKNASLQDIHLLKPSVSTGLWVIPRPVPVVSTGSIIAIMIHDLSDDLPLAADLTLNGLYRNLKAGDYLILEFLNEPRWFKVTNAYDQMMHSVPDSKMAIDGHQYNLPGSATPVTSLNLDVSVNTQNRKGDPGADWLQSDKSGIKAYFGMIPAATVVDEPNVMLLPSDPLLIKSNLESPVENFDPAKFLLQDKNTLGVSLKGKLIRDQKLILDDKSSGWIDPLTLPVDAFGNVITASRGETVRNEKMGSGDASVPGQTFKLKKKPLTYHLSPTAYNDQGVKSSLIVYVDGIKWTEVNSFYGKNEYDQVYIVRQNDQGESLVTFGDGIRGQRLPSGIDNVICNYRFGAEAAVPPAGSVNQISKPVKGLQSVKNILPAYGGADAEDAGTMRTFAPKSALILGRIVSIKDMEAVAASFPGVRAVQAEWRWDHIKQRATAHLFYIGSSSLETPLSQRIRSLSDPSTPITIETARARSFFLAINVSIDPRFLEQDVIRDLFRSLLDPGTGILAPENIGIGKPLYRSRIFESVLKIKGTEAVQGIVADSRPFSHFAITPGTGNYFDIEKGGLVINGKQNG